MKKRKKRGWIEVICGPMFCGKTEELIRRLRRTEIARLNVQVFKPSGDNRYSPDELVVHPGAGVIRHTAIAVPDTRTLLKLVDPRTNVLGIDEAQFFDRTIADGCNELANNGIRIIVAGLDMDFRGEPFGSIPILMAQAEQVDKLHAICTFKDPDGRICGKEAMYTQRIINGKPAPWDAPTVVIGAEDVYQARCRRHFKRPKKL